MNETNRSKFKKQLAALAVASALGCVPGFAGAANLGKLTVFSGLGQPLRAEVEVGAVKEELTGMLATLATPESFRQAGVDYVPALRDLQFSIEKRGAGAVIKVSSQKPLNEPFLDLLVELNWSSGRVIREYTFLLDPPDLAARQPARQVADAKVVEAAESAPLPVAPESKSRRASPGRAEAAASQAGARAPAATHLVRQGDTLRKIAQDHRAEGVSLEQMLMALYQTNRDAFIANNMNRLKAGVILNVPEPEVAAAQPEGEAKRIYLAHASNWNAYRQKLAAASAGAAVRDEAQASQASAGKVTARVDEKVAPAEQTKDQVKVARTDLPASKGGGADEIDRIAKDKALAEAQERLNLLEKNVGELQKLLEMKNRQLADIQQAQAAKNAVTPAPEAKAPEAPKPTDAPKAEPVPEAPKPPVAPPVKPEAQPVPEPAKPVEAPKAVPAPVPTEPGFIDTLLEDPLLLGAGAGVATLFGAYLLVRRRRAGVVDSDDLKAAPTTAQDAGYDATGGHDVDTDHTPPHTGEFSQAGPGLIDTDEVDPVAEADVYMAYGRDQQAEEILLDALQKDSQRLAIPVKLLEIYANRHSVQQFETLASELYAQVAGKGPEWQKVALLGQRLDPGNPLYAAAHEPDDAPAHAVAPEISAPQIDSPAETHADVPGAMLPDDALTISDEAEAPVSDAPAVASPDDAMSLDFDLGDTLTAETGAVATQATEAAGETAAPDDMSGALAFELPSGMSAGTLDESADAAELAAAGEQPESGGHAEADALAINALEFDLDLPEGAEATLVAAEPEAPALDPDAAWEVAAEPALSSAAEAPAEALAFDALPVAEGVSAVPEAGETMPPAADDTVAAIDFDISLAPATEAAPMPGFDLGTINLDLATPAPVEATLVEAAAPVRDAQWEEVNTKLDLAKAYEEMGDIEGARELLLEVVQEGTPDLAASAQAMLDRIGV